MAAAGQIDQTRALAGFGLRLDAAARERRSVLCVGLDPQPELLPPELFRGVKAGPSGTGRGVERFCEGILEAVAPHCVAVKPQLAFFEALGHAGLGVLERVCDAARAHGLLVVVDAKRGDIGSTAEAYAAAYLRPRGDARPLGDVLTVNPWLGSDGLEPFVAAAREHGGGLYVVVRSSNPGGADLQGLELADGGQVWERAAALVDRLGEQLDGGPGGAALSAVGAVVGATHPELLARARALMPRASLLLPGVGAQGGGVEALGPAFTPGLGGGLVVAARSVLYAGRATGGEWQTAAAAEAARLQQATWAVATAHAPSG